MSVAGAVTPVLVLVPPTWVGGLGVMRSLGRLGIPVYGLAHRGLSIPNASRYCAGTVRAGDNGRPTEDPEQTIEALLSAGRRLGDRVILLPGTDEWALFIAAHDEELAKVFAFSRMPLELVQTLASKQGLYRLAPEHGLPAPRFVVCPGSEAEAAHLAETLQYPVMLKPVYSRPDVTLKAVAKDRNELLASYRAMAESPEAPNVAFVEYIPGRDEDVWMFHGYFDQTPRCLAAFTGYRIREDPPHMGQTSLGVSRQNPAVIEAMTRFLTAVGYSGIVSVGCRFDPRDAQYKVLDVNPRIGGAFRMFVDANGLDVARVAYLDLTGQQVPAVVPRDGRRWFREDAELVSLKRYRQLEGLRVRDWLRSYRGVEEGSTFSLRDPLPFVCLMTLVAGYTIGGRWRRWRRWRARRQSPRQTVTFSTGFEKSKLRTYWTLLKHYRRNREFALGEFSLFCDARAVLERYLGRPIATASILEVGSGQRFTITLLFHSLGARAVGIDMDFVNPRMSFRTFWSTWRRNGPERALKTLARHLLFDRSYYQALAGALGAPLKMDSIDLRAMNATALEFPDEHFDCVFSNNVFEHINDIESASREMARVLKPGGVAYVGINLFPSLSGGHHLDWAYPDEEPSQTVPPWDHLRQNLFPTHVYLNRLREKDFLAEFGRHLTILDVKSHYQGEQHLTDDIQQELREFSREELLKDYVRVVMRKPAA